MQPRSQTHSEEGRVYGCVDEAHTSICAGGPQPRSTSMADQHDRLLCFPRRSPLTGGPHTRRPPLSHTHGGPLPTCAAAHTLPQRLSRPFLFWRGCARFRNIRLLYIVLVMEGCLIVYPSLNSISEGLRMPCTKRPNLISV